MSAAFPRPVSRDDSGDFPNTIREQDGLTKRELIAAMALQGILAGSPRVPRTLDFDIEDEGLPMVDPDRAATDAVVYATALLRALESGAK